MRLLLQRGPGGGGIEGQGSSLSARARSARGKTSRDGPADRFTSAQPCIAASTIARADFASRQRSVMSARSGSGVPVP